jgi:glucosamine--fructose-6-phosphate aminotransferase (isomerizing)
MCGIIGILLHTNINHNVYKELFDGLKQLLNRGYDSAGVCAIENDTFQVHKFASTNDKSAMDKLIELDLVSSENMYIGFGHNRWATHGVKNDINTHPHLSNSKEFAIVHNGIIENYNELKQFLIQNGFHFISQTDTEVIVNLIEYHYQQCQNIYDAIQTTIHSLKGTYGLIIQTTIEPNTLYCVRNGSPLLVGKADDKVIITSEQSGFCGNIMNYITLHNDDICIIQKKTDAIDITTKQQYNHKQVTMFDQTLTPEPFQHWTLKEIYQQPEVVLNVINNGGRIKNDIEVKLGGLEQNIEQLKKIDNIILLGCGTSFFAGLYGMYYLKDLCHFNTIQIFDGAEFEEQDIPKIGNTLFVLISQSGETSDLYRCIGIAKKLNVLTLGIINVVDSLIAREVDCGIYCNAGKEVGVASTKAFTSQVIALSMMAIWFSGLYHINEQKRRKAIHDLHNLSNDIKITLNNCHEQIKEIATTIKANNMFILGKATDEYIAKEGALKIKEISYIHSEGYSSGSLKHGPFALLDEGFPVIILNLVQKYSSKTISCYEEVIARNAPVIFITNNHSIYQSLEYDNKEQSISKCKSIFIPENNTYCSLLGIIPLQLLAYYLSIHKGINPDQPKNLAKVVTVQ